MTDRPETLGQIPSVAQLAKRIRACCLCRGWDEVELANRSGVSRTTLYHLRNGNIKRPRITTLTSLAEAFELPLQRFFWGELERPALESIPTESMRFDRHTNTQIQGVCDAHPELFSGWSEVEWEELFSTFGVGGELNEEGVVESAHRINQNRDVRYRLAVVMETHLREVAVGMVESLYRLVTPEGNLEANRDLQQLLSDHAKEIAESGSQTDEEPRSER